MTLLRLALPNSPAGGRTKAAVLNHSAELGLDVLMGCPVVFGRSVPLVPRFTSEKLPRMRGENGIPEAMVQSTASC